VEDARFDYQISMSLAGPVSLSIIGIVLLIPFELLGCIWIISAIIWAAFRVMNRGHAYQRLRDDEHRWEEMKRKFRTAISHG
jgi:hypothetical protein